jgi:hypothetical protein
LPLDARRLAGVMEQQSRTDKAYSHQSEAIATLLGAAGSIGRRHHGDR